MGFCGRINILYVITKLELGGAQKQLLGLVRELDRERFNPYIISGCAGPLIDEAERAVGDNLIRCRMLERPIRPLKDALTLFYIYRFIKDHDIDIVHTHSSKAGILGRLAARLAGVKAIVHTVHGWSFHGFQFRPAYYLYLFLEKVCAYFSSAIIVVSQCDKMRGLRSGIGTPGKYRLIRYYIERDEFGDKACALRLRRDLGLSPSDLIVGTVACLKPQKSPLDFVRVAADVLKAVPRAKFVLVGDGVLRERVSALISNLGLEKDIVLTGWRRDIPAVMSCFDVFVLTSLWEGLPIVVLEAMASFLPVVATDTGGIKEVVRHGETGYLVAPKDACALGRRLKELLSDTGLRERFSRNAGSNFNFGEYSLSSMSAKTTDLYSELCSRDKNA
jgi:glycosyltransferase involved in cell wall biosynthesis